MSNQTMQHFAKESKIECRCGVTTDLNKWLDHVQVHPIEAVEMYKAPRGWIKSFWVKCNCGDELNDLRKWLDHIHPSGEQK